MHATRKKVNSSKLLKARSQHCQHHKCDCRRRMGNDSNQQAPMGSCSVAACCSARLKQLSRKSLGSHAGLHHVGNERVPGSSLHMAYMAALNLTTHVASRYICELSCRYSCLHHSIAACVRIPADFFYASRFGSYCSACPTLASGCK